MFNLLPHLINGLTLGLLFALIALGFMLIVGVMEQINLAHGSLFALGAYVALVLVGPKPPLPLGIAEWWLAQPLGLRYALTLALAPAVVGLVGIAVELLMRRTYGKDPLFGLLLTFGVAMVIEEAIRLIWGTRDYVLPTPPAISGGFIALDLIWSAYRFYAAAIAALVIGLTWLLIEKTPYGSIIKAGAHDSEMVRALGIDLSKLRSAVFVLGTMLAAVAGIILAADLGHPPAHGRRRGRSGLPRHRARRRRLVLGRGRCRAHGRHGRRPLRRLCVGMVDAVDVPPPRRRRDGPGPRPVRQEEHPGGVMMQRLSPMPTHAAATGRRATHSEKTGISECIMMTRSWTTPTRVIVAVRRRKPLAGKRNFACIIMHRFWTTPSIIMLRCDPGLSRGSLEARTGGPVLWEQGASFEAQPFGLRTSG